MKWPLSDDINDVYKEIIEIADHEKIQNFSQFTNKNRNLWLKSRDWTLKDNSDEEIKKERLTEPNVPQIIRGDKWLDVQDSEIRMDSVFEQMVKFTFDDEASDHIAARVAGYWNDWAVQFYFNRPQVKTFLNENRSSMIECFVEVKTEFASRDGAAFICGIYDNFDKRNIVQKTIYSSEIINEKYNLYSLGIQNLTPTMYLWIAPIDAGNVKHIFVDRMLLIAK
jgi:hypothetical protein